MDFGSALNASGDFWATVGCAGALDGGGRDCLQADGLGALDTALKAGGDCLRINGLGALAASLKAGGDCLWADVLGSLAALVLALGT